jgi:geranylgeranylglycerol-phosphate geranylgeranyltransferase
VALVSIARPMNVLMAAAATVLGFWLGRAVHPLRLPFLVTAAACATAFGNVVNDLRDVATDRISHPDRPLPSGALDMISAVAYALILASTALATGFSASTAHGVGVLAALGLLLVYALVLKGVPLAGNVTVALLVAYPLLHGALGGSVLGRLWIPALLAFLLNVSREIVKDMEDAAGDHAAGYRTSAVLPPGLLRAAVGVCSLAYAGLLFLPARLGHFGSAYVFVCAAVALPLHLWRAAVLFSPRYRERLRLVSGLLKWEMLAGLAALAADELIAGRGGL